MTSFGFENVSRKIDVPSSLTVSVPRLNRWAKLIVTSVAGTGTARLAAGGADATAGGSFGGSVVRFGRDMTTIPTMPARSATEIPQAAPRRERLTGFRPPVVIEDLRDR